MNKKIKELLFAKAGLLDNFSFPVIPDHQKSLVACKVLSQVSDQPQRVHFHDVVTAYLAHIEYLELAFTRKIHGDEKRYGQFVYPRCIDAALELQIATLKQRIEKTNGFLAFFKTHD